PALAGDRYRHRPEIVPRAERGRLIAVKAHPGHRIARHEEGVSLPPLQALLKGPAALGKAHREGSLRIESAECIAGQDLRLARILFSTAELVQSHLRL